MNKTERHELAKTGKIILRPQLKVERHREYWTIVKYTLSGGWSLFQGGTAYQFDSFKKADDRIDDLVMKDPDKYHPDIARTKF